MSDNQLCKSLVLHCAIGQVALHEPKFTLEEKLHRFRTILDGLFQIPSRSALNSFLGRQLSAFGFDGFCLTGNVGDREPFVREDSVTNWPLDKAGEYMSNQFYAHDPALRHICRHRTPYLWKAENLGGSTKERQFGDFLMGTSVRSGMVIPVFQGADRFAVLSLSRNHSSNVEVSLVPEAIFIASSLSLKLSEDVWPNDAMMEKIWQLSPLQKDILKWVAEGKSNTDISCICNLTKRNIDYHVGEILRKLAVATRAQAASIFAIHADDA